MSQLLLSELNALSSESKRKSPEVRTASDAALNALKSKGEEVLNARGELAVREANNVLLQPIFLACEGKSATPKVVSIAVGLLQRVIALGIVHPDDCAKLASVLQHVVDTRIDVEVQLKILQAVSSLLSSYPSVHDTLLSQILRLCFQLQESRVGVVSSTAAATLRQAIMTIFDRVRDEDNVLNSIKAGGEDAAAAAPLAAMTVALPGSASVTLFPCSRDTYMILSDLNMLANNEEAPFLGLKSLPRTFTLELLESILTNHAHLFQSEAHPELLLCLRQSTCPLLIKAFNEQASFPTTLRLMRLLFVMLRHFSHELIVEVEILITILLRFVSAQPLQMPTVTSPTIEQKRGSMDPSAMGSGVPAWQRVLAMEAVRSLCSDGSLMRNLWKWFDGKPDSVHVFTKLVDTLHVLATENAALIGQADPVHQLNAATPATSNQKPSTSMDKTRHPRRRSSTGIYSAAAGVANAAISGLTSVSDLNVANGPAGVGLTQPGLPNVQLIDQLDKTDVPSIPPAYIYILSLQAIVHLAQALAAYVLPVYSQFVNARPRTAAKAPPALDFATLSQTDRAEIECARDMIQHSWAPILDSLTFFMASKCDDVFFAEVLVALRNFTNTTGALGLTAPRDALIASLTRFAIPRDVIAKLSAIRSRPVASEDVDASLSERNAACLKAVTQIAYYLSGSLGTHWRDVLETLCDAEYVLRRSGNRRKSLDGGESVPTSPIVGTMHRPSLASISALTTIPSGFTSSSSIDAATAKPVALTGLDTPTLLVDISRVFENSSALSNAALLPFIEALCELDADHIGLAAVTKTQTPSPLNRSSPLSSLATVAMLNIQRLAMSTDLETAWLRVTEHLLSLTSNAALRPTLRAQAASALDAFVLAALRLPDGELNVDVQRRSIDVLSQQSVLEGRRKHAADVDVRRLGLETFLTVLEAHGHALQLGWETMLTVFRTACAAASSDEDRSSVALVKVAFAAMQVLCSNLLGKLSADQLKLCVETLTSFSLQDEDVNVALTANGAVWGITAELTSRAEVANTPTADVVTRSEIDFTDMWIHILLNVKRSTDDGRLQVRNGAISILFSILEQYGTGLSEETWQTSVMENVLLPLLKGLHDRSRSMSDIDGSVSKEWDESRILALTSTGKVVRQVFISKLLNAHQPWSRLLRCFENDFLQGPNVVSQASIKGLHHILQVTIPQSKADDELTTAWQLAWSIWCDMGWNLLAANSTFTQANLLAFVETVTPLYALLGRRLSVEQIAVMLSALKAALTYGKNVDERISDRDRLTPLQSSILARITSLHLSPVVTACVLADLAEYSTLALIGNAASNAAASYIALNRAATDAMTQMYEQHGNESELYRQGAVQQLFSALAVPLKLRYGCPKPGTTTTTDIQPLWKGSMRALCKASRVFCRSIDSIHIPRDKVEALWKCLLSAFSTALLADCTPILSMAVEAQEAEEAFDLLLLSTLERDIWAHLGRADVPSESIVDLAKALSQTSSLRGVSGEQDGDGSDQVPREVFAYWCLDLLTLLCSAVPHASTEEVRRLRRTAALALPILVDRLEGTVASYVEERGVQGSVPMGRIRDEEINFILFRLSHIQLWPDALMTAEYAVPTNGVHTSNIGSQPDLGRYSGEDRRPSRALSGESKRANRSGAMRSPFALLYHLYPLLCDLLFTVVPRHGGRASAMTKATCGCARLYQPVELQDESLEVGTIGRPLSLASDGVEDVTVAPYPADPRRLTRELLDIVSQAWM